MDSLLLLVQVRVSLIFLHKSNHVRLGSKLWFGGCTYLELSHTLFLQHGHPIIVQPRLFTYVKQRNREKEKREWNANHEEIRWQRINDERDKRYEIIDNEERIIKTKAK